MSIVVGIARILRSVTGLLPPHPRYHIAVLGSSILYRDALNAAEKLGQDKIPPEDLEI